MKLIKKVNPISIRKLKKYYILKTNIHGLYGTRDNDIIIRYCDDSYDKLKGLPNLYMSKKITDKIMSRSYKNKNNFYFRWKYWLYKKVNEVHISMNVPARMTIRNTTKNAKNRFTLYTVFDSESEYLKWKLKS